MVPRTIKWGSHVHTVSVAQRTRHNYGEKEIKLREDLSYLASICGAAKNGDIEFYTSFELDREADRHAISLKGYLGIDLLEGIPMKEGSAARSKNHHMGSARIRKCWHHERRAEGFLSVDPGSQVPRN
jgi:hypothetical protein